MVKSLAELYRYRQLLRHLVAVDLKVRYRKSVFGFLWTLLNPLLLMLVLWAVFSRVTRVEEHSYPLFLLTGIMVWVFFQQSIDQSLNSIVKNRSLIQKIYVPKLVFPLAVVASNLVNVTFFLCAYLIVALATGVGVPATAPLIVPALLMVALLAAGVALLMCSLNVFFRDFTHMTSIFLRAAFYVTPIIYRPSHMGAGADAFLQLNPMYYPVVLARAVLYDGAVSHALWLPGFGFGVAALLLGLLVFTRVEDKFVYYA